MIHVIWPTIRPAVAVKRALEWFERSSKNALAFRFWFGVNSREHLNALIAALGNDPPFMSYTHYFDARTGVTDTATKLTAFAVGCYSGSELKQSFILASDDFEAHQDWDKTVEFECLNHAGPIIFNDAYAKETNIIPIPVVSGVLLKKLNGILYHPAYHHFFSDQELFDVFTEMGNVKNLRGVGSPTFTHRHWSFGGRDRDEYDVRNTQKWDADKATYEKRKSLSLADKLKL